MLSKNVIKMSVKDLQGLYQNEIARLKNCNLNKIGNRSNNNGGIHKCNYAIYLLDSLSSDTILTIEGCWGDMVIRDFCLSNSGSVVECIIKAILDRENKQEYCKAWLDSENDAKNGFNALEVKASLDSHFKCTPAQGNKTTLLVNRSGVSIIRKCDVQGCTDSKGRLPSTGLFGSRENFMVKWLEQMLGIEGGYEE